MSKVVALSGVGGFIGAHILEAILNDTNWKVVGIASWKHMGTPERIEEVLKSNPLWKHRVTIITHDLSSPIPRRTQERIGHVDYIINAAAESHVDRSIEDPVPFIQNNVNVALNMLEFARICKPEVFIQVSTDEVYGVAPEGTNHPEWAPIVPSNPYSASKACQEAIAISYWRTYGVPVVITNTMNNFGEMQDPEKFMAKIIRFAASGEEIPVHGTEDKIGSRFYLHARNHADALLFLLGKKPTMYEDGKHTYPDRYNVVGDTELDNLEVVERISEVMPEYEINYRFVDFHSTRPGHDHRYALDGTKLKKAGWKAPVPFKVSLSRYVKWTLKNPIWL